MAELTAGAVSSLLGLLRNEAALLRGVAGDVQFIKAEMESMKSFLEHLTRMERHAGEHSEQVRTWMSQVRLLAQDCNNCIDMYLYHSNPDIHIAKSGLRRYLLWAPWFLKKMVARHRAAAQLRDIKERAQDIYNRRSRYLFELPAREAEDDRDSDDALQTLRTTTASPEAATTSTVDDDYLSKRLVEWVSRARHPPPTTDPIPPSILFVLPEPDRGDDKDEDARALALARRALAMAQAHFSRRSILVDLPKVHWDPLPLRRKEILYYILREIRLTSQSQQEHQAGNGEEEIKPITAQSQQEHQAGNGEEEIKPFRSQSQQEHQAGNGEEEIKPIISQSQGLQQEDLPGNDDSWSTTKWDIYHLKKSLLRNIKQNIKEMQIDEKLAEVKDSVIHRVEGDQPLMMLSLLKTKKQLRDEIAKQPFDVLLRLLIRSTAFVAEQDQPSKKVLLALSELYDDIIKTTAIKLQELMEEAKASSKQLAPCIRLGSTECEDILKEVFPINTSSTTTTNTNTNTSSSTNTLVEDQIKDMMIHYKVLQEDGSDTARNQEMVVEHAKTQEVAFTVVAIKQIKQNIREQMKIKGIMHEIQNHLNGESILIILKTDHRYVSIPQETIGILRLLGTSGCFAGAAMVTATTTEMFRQGKKHFCCPQLELIEYSRVGHYLETVIQYTGQHIKEDHQQLLRSILEECEPDEFCMRIFVHALKAKPKRNLEEISKLHSILQTTPKSLLSTKMLEFSYSDLPRQHKSCLLYLSIFPADSKPLRRSTLIGRWVAEGLTNTEEWTWSSSVAEAEKCFDALIDRCLVSAADISAAGRVKSCTVDSMVHRFIIKILMKQRIVGMSVLHLARYFSFFNDARLRSSDTIETFLHKISELSNFSKLKVLDLEDCRYFTKNQRCLKHICRKMLMLRYLSLRRTDVTQLPHQINNLHELEVLDIRETDIPVSATRNILLPKLKRLLAGHTDTSPSSTATSMVIPEMIIEMKDVEVLSNVKPIEQGDLQGIGGLSQLKKLGVVINKDSHLKDLLQVLSSPRGLRFLSITLDITTSESSPHGESFSSLRLESLESLSIRSGSTQMGWLLPLLATKHCERLGKVTLSRTSVNQDGLKVLANLPKLRCFRLLNIAYDNSELTFNKDEFLKLNILVVNSSNITKIHFTEGPPELEKIIWSFTKIDSLFGINNLPRLKNIELIGGEVPHEVKKEIRSILGLHFKHKQHGHSSGS